MHQQQFEGCNARAMSQNCTFSAALTPTPQMPPEPLLKKLSGMYEPLTMPRSGQYSIYCVSRLGGPGGPKFSLKEHESRNVATYDHVTIRLSSFFLAPPESGSVRSHPHIMRLPWMGAKESWITARINQKELKSRPGALKW